MWLVVRIAIHSKVFFLFFDTCWFLGYFGYNKKTKLTKSFCLESFLVMINRCIYIYIHKLKNCIMYHLTPQLFTYKISTPVYNIFSVFISVGTYLYRYCNFYYPLLLHNIMIFPYLNNPSYKRESSLPETYKYSNRSSRWFYCPDKNSRNLQNAYYLL